MATYRDPKALGLCVRLLVVFFLLVPLFLGGPAFAQDVAPDVKQAWMRFTREHGTQWRVTWDPVLGTPKSLRGGLYKPLPGDPEQVAKRFLADNRDLFQLRVDLADLSLEYRKQSPAGTHVTFQQSYQGLPVFNGGLDIHITSAGQVFLVHNRYAPEAALAQVSLKPSLSAEDARQLAEADYRSYGLSDKAGKPFQPGAAVVTVPPELGIYRVPTGYRLAYRVTVGVVRYVIDAHSGDILERTELIQFVDGSGQVFDPNPVNTLEDTTLRDRRDRDYPALAGAYFTRTLREITQLNSKFRLEGPFVKTEDIPADACFNGFIRAWERPPVRRDTNFVFTRNKSGFEHVMAYFHLDNNQRYIQSLGFLDINNRQHRVDAHAIWQDQSFYCPSPLGSGYLAFGDGGVDDAEDADVILHEYGHSIQDNQTNGKYLSGVCRSKNETLAMGEGFGDYWAFSNGPTGSNSFDPACFAEWDAQGGCLRRLDSPKRYPEDMVEECHANGEIWSAALRDIFDALGKPITDRLVLESHFLVPSNPTFSDGAQALLDADERLYGGAFRDVICSAMINRGIGASGCGLWITLNWDQVGSDVDLHLRPPDGKDYVGWDYPNDCAYYNMNPDWGVEGDSSDDPRLYWDCITDCTFEQITLDKFTDPGTYKVLIHYYRDHGLGPTTATVEVFQGDIRIFEGSAVLSNPGDDPDTGDIWIPLEIIIGEEMVPTIKLINKIEKSRGGYPGLRKK